MSEWVYQPDETGDDSGSILWDSFTSSLANTNFQAFDLNNAVGSTLARVLMRVDFTGFPVFVSIDEAILSLTTRSISVSRACEANAVLSGNASWGETTVTWNKRDGVNAWAGSAGCSTAGVDYDGTAMGSWTSTASGGAGVVDNIGLNVNVIADWIRNPSTNHGMILRSVGSSGNILYAAPSHTTAAYRPKLTVTYTVAHPSVFRPHSFAPGYFTKVV